MTTLIRTGTADDDLDALTSRAAELERSLNERLAERDVARTSLERFRIRYKQEVGLLHDELDRLELAIAEAELGELSRKLEENDASGRPGPSDAPPHPPPARFTSDVVRRLFREVAKAIHPDLASDDVARDRRHALMIEANRAYARGDEEHLRWILQAWAGSPESVQGSDPEAARQRLVRRVAQLEEELERLTSDLDALKATPLWELKTMVDQAAVRGRDLVRDMVSRLKRDVMAATNRLDAMRTPD